MSGTMSSRFGPWFWAVGVVGLALSGLLVGLEPIGGDPDNMYRPIKEELGRALSSGTLPFWSDRMGLGAPLVAESHAAAFYPLNWLLYSLLKVSLAYRIAMWLHVVALAAAMFAYARTLRLTPAGSALAAVALCLCGFQASHAAHEPFYHALPYLPFALLCAESFLATGRAAWLAAMALTLGVQCLIGHFQIQFWTMGLAVLTGATRLLQRRARWSRVLTLLGGVAWGVAIASVQLGLTFELTEFSGFRRPPITLTNYAFPPAHWAQLAYPALFTGVRADTVSRYWNRYTSTPEEATFYVGTVTLALACVGLLANRDRELSLWRWLIPVSFGLATMSLWWLDGYLWILKVPGLGLFRAPGRYTLLTSIGLCLLAGRGLDRLAPPRRFWSGLALAAVFGAAATAWASEWSAAGQTYQALGEEARTRLLAMGLVVWCASLVAVALWRVKRISPAWPLLFVACELTYCFYTGPTPWGRPFRLAEDSPVLRRLVEERDVGLVGGWVRNTPVRLGLATADPYVGITAPPPNYLLASAAFPWRADHDYRAWMRRFGVTHGIVAGRDIFLTGDILWSGQDPVLDAVLPSEGDRSAPRYFRLERYSGALPAAHVAVQARVAADWFELFPMLTLEANPELVWFERRDAPPDPPGPRASTARLLSWNGRSGEVEHDGSCDLVLRRAFYPGWTARVNGGPETPVSRADGGLQSVRLAGSGVSRVEVRYRPTGLIGYAALSSASAAAALAVMLAGAARFPRQKSSTFPPESNIETERD